ncbi:MAG: hypothetical protein M3421_04240, partial [Bacteroidota bacterium]|nr:hypothetical protein [Bacteroidota bacterium]
MKSMIAMVFCFAALPLVGFATSPVSVNVKFPSAQREILYSNTEVFKFLGQTPSKAQTDANGYVKLTININRPNLLIIGTREANCRLYLLPGETYSIEFTPSDEKNRVRITGNNAEGQHLINNSPPKSYGSAPAKQWNLEQKGNLLQILENRIDLALSPYKALLEEGKINKQFYSIVSLEEGYYQAYTLSQALLMNIMNNKSGKALESDTEQSGSKILESLFQKYPVNHKDLIYSSSFTEYIGNYITFFTSNNKGYDEAVKRNEGYTYIMAILKKKLHAASYRYYAFSFLEERIHLMEREFISLYEHLSKEYPEITINHGRLPAQVDEIKAMYAEAGAISLPSEIRIIENHEEINGLEELLEKFKGRALFVDLWATWCGPCLGDFESQAPLKEFLIQNEIDLVYVAMEHGNNVDKWKAFLKKYDLSGYHAIANGKFQQDIKASKDIGYDGGRISIPRYLIVN